MKLCPHALFNTLKIDVYKNLPTYPFDPVTNYRDMARPECGGREYACLALLDSFLKKFEDDVEEGADERAIAKFLDANKHCLALSIDRSNMTEIEAVALGEFESTIWKFFEPDGDHYWLDPVRAIANGRFGPGASVGVKGTSFYRKVGSAPLTTSKTSIYRLYLSATVQHSLAEGADITRAKQFGLVDYVPGSVLSCVPKSRDIKRTICTEPSLEMYLQQGIAEQLTQRLESFFGISLPLQESRNQCLAEIGSRTGRYGTIDLQSASDTIALSMLREVLPRYAFSIFAEARSDNVLLPDGNITPLHMVSSMGNAFTFPLQTAIFCSVVWACYRALGIRLSKPVGAYTGNYGVYGDDIIVYREAYALVSTLLKRLGFKVNATKSFNEGPFRESCGADFWHGYNVRGIYCKTLKTKQDSYSLVNRLMTWSCNHGVDLTLTLKYLVSVSGIKYVPIPPWESEDAGVRVPWSMASMLCQKRDKGTGSVVYLAYRSAPKSIDFNSIESARSDEKPRRRTIKFLSDMKEELRRKGLIVNSDAILLSALGGYLEGGRLVERQPAFYKKRACVAPCWEWHSPSLTGLTGSGWRRWLYYAGAVLGEAYGLPDRAEVTG